MKRITLLICLLFVLQNRKADAQCTCNYSFTGTTDTLTFTNLSTVSNAHYYWNFGDGQTSYATNPVHIFPESGRYLVTLFAKDTVSNCHTYHDSWILVVNPSTDPCSPGFGDSIIFNSGNYYIVTYDSSSNCGMYYSDADIANSWGGGVGGWDDVSGWNTSLFIGDESFYTHDSINGYVIKRAFYKTIPYHYNNSINYDSCSANFEYDIDYQASGALVHLKSMNPSATSYQFAITGFGNPIYYNSSTASYLYPYYVYGGPYFPYLISSITQGITGCRDTVTHEILIRNINYVIPPTCAMPTPPQNESAVIGTNVIFYITTTSSLLTKQWQQDAGLGYVNLTNAGPYNGVSTDTLTISNVQLTMNNYHYRCVLSDESAGGSGCHNTSTDGVLTVTTLGIDVINENNSINIYPNPFTEQTTITFIEVQKNTIIYIRDVLGNIIEQTNINGKQSTIDMSGVSKGIYFVQITDEKKNVINKKIVVQ